MNTKNTYFRLIEGGLLRKFACSLIVALLLFLLLTPSTVHAAPTTQDGVDLEITTDKSAYTKGETVKAVVNVTNNNTVAITNLSLQITLPSGLVLQQVSDTITLTSLAAGASQTFTFNEIAAQNLGPAKTGDSANLLLGAVLALVSLVTLFLVTYKRKKLSLSKATKPLLLALCVVLASACLLPAAPAYAAPVKKSMSAQEHFSFDGRSVVVSATLSFELEAPSVTVTPATVDATTGTSKTETLSVTVVVPSGATEAVTWSVADAGTTDSTVSTTGGITISSAGELTIPDTTQAGTAIIRATSDFDPSVYGECTVIVVRGKSQPLESAFAANLGLPNAIFTGGFGLPGAMVEVYAIRDGQQVLIGGPVIINGNPGETISPFAIHVSNFHFVVGETLHFVQIEPNKDPSDPIGAVMGS